MTYLLKTQADLERAMAELLRKDPRLKKPLEHAEMPELRRREPGFAGLAMIVVGQQLSTASATAIWGRVTAALTPFTPEAVRRARSDRLGRLGLSGAKIKTLKFVAGEIIANRLDLDGLVNLDADVAHKVLTSLHGVGPWTADVYLLFCVGHGDAWPGGDLAIQEGVRLGLNLPTRPSPKDMGPLAESWRPYRGAAAHLWWAYYKFARKREGAPVPTTTKRVSNRRKAKSAEAQAAARPRSRRLSAGAG